MFCGQCGFELEEDDSFCRNCGRSTTGEPGADTPRVCTRQPENRKIAGVCSGCAAYFGKDVVMVRIIWALAAILPPLFPGVAAYVLGWLLMPQARAARPVSAPQ